MKHLPECIESQRLLLRQVIVEDAQALHQVLMESVEYHAPWLDWATASVTLEDRESFCEDAHNAYLEGKEAIYGIWLKEGNQVIGTIKASPIDWSIPSAEIGYWGAIGVQGKGYISEASRTLCHYLLDVLEFERVWLTCDTRNIASQRVAERIGMKREAHLRHDHLNPQNELSDTYVYAMIRLDKAGD